MSENQQNPDTDLSTTTNPPDWRQPDDVLAVLVDVVNSQGSVELGVTLHVGGTFIDGLLVSGRSYFDLLAKRITDGVPGNPIGEALANGMKERGDSYREKERANRGADDEQDPDAGFITTYVHLRAASARTAGQAEPIELGLWRARLTTVDGWTFGNFGPKPPLDQQ